MSNLIDQKKVSHIYYIIVELVQSDILGHLTKIYSPKVFLLTKIKPEYANIMYNPTNFPCPFVCRSRKVPLYYIFTT